MDVKQLLIDVLESAKYPVFLQGSLSEDEDYPKHFFTFWNNDTEDMTFYDNVENTTEWNFDVNFYSIDPTLVNSILRSMKSKLRLQGFIVNGVGYDLFSDEPTHTGRGMNVTYLERINK